jgi:hypothetical protein
MVLLGQKLVIWQQLKEVMELQIMVQQVVLLLLLVDQLQVLQPQQKNGQYQQQTVH